MSQKLCGFARRADFVELCTRWNLYIYHVSGQFSSDHFSQVGLTWITGVAFKL